MPATDQLSRAFLTFLFQVTVGGFAAMALIPFHMISRQFFRITGLTLLAIAGITAWRYGLIGWEGTWPIRLFSLFLLLLTLYNLSLWQPRALGRRLLHSLGTATGGMLLLADAAAYGTRWGLGLTAGMVTANTLVSAIVLGTSLNGLLLGHRYLNETHLPVTLIKRVSDIFTASLLLQGALPALFTGLIALVADGGTTEGWLTTLGQHWLLLFGRMSVGIGASLVVALVILNCLRLPNVQAATGFYYIACLTVFLGEFLGRYLLVSASLPF